MRKDLRVWLWSLLSALTILVIGTHPPAHRHTEAAPECPLCLNASGKKRFEEPQTEVAGFSSDPPDELSSIVSAERAEHQIVAALPVVIWLPAFLDPVLPERPWQEPTLFWQSPASNPSSPRAPPFV